MSPVVIIRTFIPLLVVCNFFISGQTSYTFTPAGATGSAGPSSTQINFAYSGTGLSVTTVSAGVQSFTIPLSGVYHIDATGASGGNSYTVSGTPPTTYSAGAGLGARVQGEFSLTAGGVLEILVGQQGDQGPGSGGGGGGTFVLYNGNLLIAAGGGGGASHNMNGVHGSTTSAGTMCSLNAVSGGVNGGGGQACIGMGGNGGGGGGFVGDGFPGLPNNFPGAHSGGLSYGNGGTGGGGAGPMSTLNLTVTGPPPCGGFGGGGGVQGGSGNNAYGGLWFSGGGGGGGGYSGGAGGKYGFAANFNNCGINNLLSAGGGGGGSWGSLCTGLSFSSPYQSGSGRVILTLPCVWIERSNTCRVCAGTTVSLSTNAVSNFSWSTGSTSSSIVVTPSATTIYSLSGQGVGCTGSNTTIVEVIQSPSVNILASTSTLCEGSGLTATANVSGGLPPYALNWSGAVSGSLLSFVQPAGTYTVTLSATDTRSCTGMAIHNVTVHPSPALSFSGNAVCANSTGTLVASGALTYTWAGFGTSGSSYTFSPTQASVVVVGSSSVGCISQSTVTITVVPPLTISVSSNSVTCANLGSGTIVASGGSGSYSYLWSPANFTAATVSSLAPGTQSIFVTDIATGCTYSTVEVFLSPIPLTGMLMYSSSVRCAALATGSASFINLAGGSSTQNYLWTNGASTFTMAHPVGLSPGTWTTVVTDALTGCQINSVFAIAQPPALTVNISVASSTVCAGNSNILTGLASGGTGTFTYQWTNGPPLSTHTVTQPNGGTFVYTLTATDANSCSVSNTVTVGFIANPVLTITHASICPLETGTLSVTGANSYTWSNNSNANSNR
jgi:hypothetical protein